MIKKKSRDQAYDNIRDLILSMKIKPGQSVTENALSDQLGIGRTPVREALARLESEGLIYSKNGRKTVYSLTLDEIKEIFDIKYALEGAMAAWAAERGSAADKKRLKSVMTDMKKHARARPENERERENYLDSWIKIDKALHEVIFKMAGSEKATRIIEKLNIQWHRTRISVYAIEGRILRSSKEHEEFVNHIIEGNARKAEESMRKHLQKLKSEIENVMKLFNYPT